ncbi:MAG TPA: biotin/lipoyl-binding protein [Candidatus Xenobia bacterium]
MEGRVLSVSCREGDTVQAGATLAVLDDRRAHVRFVGRVYSN